MIKIVRTKIKYSNFCRETGESEVILFSYFDQKNYCGHAKFNFTNDDTDAISSFLGCRIAEMRAYRKVLKAKLKQNLATQSFINSHGGFYSTKGKEYLTSQIENLRTEIKKYSETNIIKFIETYKQQQKRIQEELASIKKSQKEREEKLNQLRKQITSKDIENFIK